MGPKQIFGPGPLSKAIAAAGRPDVAGGSALLALMLTVAETTALPATRPRLAFGQVGFIDLLPDGAASGIGIGLIEASAPDQTPAGVGRPRAMRSRGGAVTVAGARVG